MHKKHKNKIRDCFNKIAQGAVLTIIILILILALGPDSLRGEFLFYETMPYYTMAVDYEPAFFKFSDDENHYYTDMDSEDNEFTTEYPQGESTLVDDIGILQSEYIETYNPIRIEDDEVYAADSGIYGLNDVIYQDEAEFGPYPDSQYKENFTEADIDRLRDVDYLLSSFYNKDASAGIVRSRFNVDKFLNTDLKMKKDGSSGPQVLIFHTHGSTEFFIDSDTSDLYEGIIGAGDRLKYYLENKYNISVLHHTGIYDEENGRASRNGSYERMEPVIQQILDENPSIQFVIDLHRDGIEPDPQLVTYIDGKPYAKIMFVNGVSAINEDGAVRELTSLLNPNLDTNLALSFNMQIAANELYPDFTRRIYLKTYRFSTHMKAKSLLVEIGSQYNTKEEAFNAMELLADLINEVVF